MYIIKFIIMILYDIIEVYLIRFLSDIFWNRNGSLAAT